MQKTIRKKNLVSAVLVFGLLTVLVPARGDLITNGDFANGLNGWTVSDSSLVSVVNGQAVISESSTDQEVDLYQTFTIPTGGALSLSFKLLGLTGDDGIAFAAFGASLLDPNSLLDPTKISLVPTVDSFTDSFYTQDVGSQGRAATGVTPNPPPDHFPLLITVDISSLAAGTPATILFRLISGIPVDFTASSTNASVTLGDVTVHTTAGPGPNPVPEPSTAIIVALSAISLTGYYRARRKRAA